MAPLYFPSASVSVCVGVCVFVFFPRQFREKFGIADHMVAFDVVEIIEIPGYGRSAAVKVCARCCAASQTPPPPDYAQHMYAPADGQREAFPRVTLCYCTLAGCPALAAPAAAQVCEEKGITSQNDTAKLAEAKEEVYVKGFYEGVLLVGSQAGKRVCDAKDLVRAEMIAAGFATPYFEPEKLVCVRALLHRVSVRWARPPPLPCARRLRCS